MKKVIFVNLIIAIFNVFAPATAQTEPMNYKFIYAGDKATHSYLGLQQGLSEANLQGKFLGQTYTLDTVNPADVLDRDYAGYLAVFAAVDQEAYRKLVEKLPDVAVFNLTLEDDSLRALCLPNALHVPPSKQMKLDSEEQWRKKSADSKAVAQAWHASFEKYAARELNNRFRKANDVKMDDASWAGWAAIKMVTDTVARQKITDAGKLLTFLKNDLVFDGQKGTDMSFRATGQLRQILLLVENDEIVGEAPVAGVVKPNELDTLGNIECAK